MLRAVLEHHRQRAGGEIEIVRKRKLRSGAERIAGCRRATLMRGPSGDPGVRHRTPWRFAVDGAGLDRECVESLVLRGTAGGDAAPSPTSPQRQERVRTRDSQAGGGPARQRVPDCSTTVALPGRVGGGGDATICAFRVVSPFLSRRTRRRTCTGAMVVAANELQDAAARHEVGAPASHRGSRRRCRRPASVPGRRSPE